MTGDELGRTTVTEHIVTIGDAAPIRQPPYRVPIALKDTMKELDRMLQLGVAEPSSSPWASPVVLAEKKDGGVRFCVDYRNMNQVAKFDAYPMPRIEEVLEQVGPATCISTLDLAQGYWQVHLEEGSEEKTAIHVGTSKLLTVTQDSVHEPLKSSGSVVKSLTASSFLGSGCTSPPPMMWPR